MGTVLLGEERRGTGTLRCRAGARPGPGPSLPALPCVGTASAGLTPQTRSPCHIVPRGIPFFRPLGTRANACGEPRGLLPSKSELPFFIPLAEAWGFFAFQPGSSSLWRSLQQGGRGRLGGWPSYGPVLPGVIYGCSWVARPTPSP